MEYAGDIAYKVLLIMRFGGGRRLINRNRIGNSGDPVAGGSCGISIGIGPFHLHAAAEQELYFSLPCMCCLSENRLQNSKFRNGMESEYLSIFQCLIHCSCLFQRKRSCHLLLSL